MECLHCPTPIPIPIQSEVSLMIMFRSVSTGPTPMIDPYSYSNSNSNDYCTQFGIDIGTDKVPFENKYWVVLTIYFLMVDSSNKKAF